MMEPSETEHVENLWSSILDSVSSTRSIPSKQVLILGDRVSGKSTIACALLGKRPDSSRPDKSDFALGYDWADIRDDADEGMSSNGTCSTVFIKKNLQIPLRDCRFILFHPTRARIYLYYLIFSPLVHPYNTLWS